MNNAERTIRKNLVVLLLALSLAFLPFSKVMCHVPIILYIVLCLTEGNWSEKFTTFKNSFILQLFMGWMFLTIAGLFFPDSGAVSIFPMEKKIFLFALPVFIATSVVKLSPADLRLIFYLFTAICFGVIIYSVVGSWIQWNAFTNDRLAFERIDFLNSSNYFADHPEVSKSWVFFTYIGLAKGANLHPSYLSLYLAFCIFFLLTEHFRPLAFRYQQGLNIFFIGVFLIALVFLSSRIIIFSMATIFAALCIYEIRIRQSRKHVVLILLLLAGFIAGIFLNPISRHRNWKELANMSYRVNEHTHYRTSSEIRASLWWLGWKSFQSVNPLFGAGAGNVDQVMKEQAAKYKITNVLGTYDPHNQFLYTLIANGLLGLSMFAGIIGLGFITAFREKQPLLLFSLMLFSLLCVTESALELQKGIVFFALVFSLLTFRDLSFERLNLPSTSFAGAGN